MAKTTFTDKITRIVSEWLNEVNVAIFDAIGDGTNAPTTGAQVRTNIGAGTGDGNVVGPASSTDSGFAKFDGITGELLKDSAATIAVADGGTGATTAGGARTNLSVASSGANSDITSLSGLTTPLSVAQGGTAATTSSAARTSLGAAASGANSDITSLTAVTSGSVFRKNALINGNFSVAQRGTSFTSATTPANNDDTYLLDQWTLLSNGNDIIDVSQNTATVPANGLYSCALDVETANAKFGIINFIEQKNCIGLIGNTCTLSFKARKGAANSTVASMRAVILSWSGTADTITSDVVSAWGASGTNPTLAANWTAENTAADLTLTDTFQTFSVSAAIDTASAKNIAVFLYYNNADGTVGDFIYIADVQLESESVATEFEYRHFSEELALGQRYTRVFGGEGANDDFCIAYVYSTTQAVGILPFATMRAAPSATFNTASNFAVTDTSGGLIAVTVIALSRARKDAISINITVAGGLIAGSASELIANSTTNARITLSAEL